MLNCAWRRHGDNDGDNEGDNNDDDNDDDKDDNEDDNAAADSFIHLFNIASR